MSDKMRELFEKWAIANGLNVSWRSGDDYLVDGTITAWAAWQAAQSAAVPVVGEVEALICDDCGAETNDPWHSSKGTRRHYHRCDPCNSITAAELDALRKDAERYREALIVAFQHIDQSTHCNDHALVAAAIAGEGRESK